MTRQTCHLIGMPIDCGKRRRGCLMGPDALRTAGIATALEGLGLTVRDWGNVAPGPAPDTAPPVPQAHAYAQTIAWTRALHDAGMRALAEGFAIFLGGDHALSLGTVAAAADHAAGQKRPLFVLWLDAHSDFHTPQSSASGNLHGTPLGYAAGLPGFDGFPPLANPVPTEHICMLGLRSVDSAEAQALADRNIRAHDMRSIDEAGIAPPLAAFLAHVQDSNGMLHVSLDVDFLDPAIAPAVGTTVPGGATFREAHLVMEMLHDSRLVTSLDLVELNPFLDERGRTASLMVDLTASLLGRQIFDRPTHAFG